MDIPESSIILAFTDDWFLVPRLEDAARSLGYGLATVGAESAGADETGAEPPRRVPLTEPLAGPDADLIHRLVSDPPALLLFDLAAAAIPWRRWIQVLKTSSATRRLPIVAFGPHVEAGQLDEARRLGADRVVSRGQLQGRLIEILQAEARPPDRQAIQHGCERPMTAEAHLGLEALGAGAYFDAHEHLERAVLAEPGPEGAVLRALLHLAVACLHTERGNWRGAQKMLLRMQPWLAPLPAQCRRVDVSSLRAALAWLRETLEAWHERGVTPPVPLPPPQIRLVHETAR